MTTTFRYLGLTAIAVVALLLVSGCAAVRPDSLRIEGEHISHISQHFGSDRTEYGVEAAMLELHWKRGDWFADIADGMILNQRNTNLHGGLAYGSMLGPREMFEARAGYEVLLK